MIASPYFWLAGVALMTACAAAVAVRSLAEFSRHELDDICRRRGSLDRLGQIIKRHELVALAAQTLQVLASALFVASTVIWVHKEPFTATTPGWYHLCLLIVAGMTLLLAVQIWIPWAVVRLWAEPFLYFTWPFWQAASVALTPLVLGARFTDIFFHRLLGRIPEIPDEESFEDEIRTIVTEGHREGLLEEDAREMIEGVIELSDVAVSEIMTPRTDMVSIPLSFTWSEALDFVIKVGHTRIPAYDENRDDIVGILYVKDFLPELAKGTSPPVTPWSSLLREPHFIPETKPVDVLLQEFQRDQQHMVVVLDEYGGVSGLVTMEDVLEEIVGEIVDEYDKDLVDGIRRLDDRTTDVLGKVHIDEINDRLDLGFPDDGDFDTIGGFVFSELGHVPAVGEELVHKNVRITVLEATRRRIERVRLEILDRSNRETA